MKNTRDNTEINKVPQSKVLFMSLFPPRGKENADIQPATDVSY